MNFNNQKCKVKFGGIMSKCLKNLTCTNIEQKKHVEKQTEYNEIST